jgi:hypothetical protein
MLYNDMSMERFLLVSVTALALFAAFSSSTNYSLNSYSVGPAGTSDSHSTTYYTQASGGEVSSGTAISTNHTGTSGGVQTEQLSLPQAPTLGTSSGTYYNRLLVTLNDNAGTNNYPTDVTFSIAVSTTNCFTSSCINGAGVQFVQTGGALGSSQFYQSYSAWGSTSGTTVTGLSPSTTYYVAVAAKEGMFTNTEYGTSASATTASPSLTFSVSPNSLSLGNLTPGSVITSSAVSFTLTTNGVYGANIFNAGQYSGLHSTLTGGSIPALTGNLSSSSHGFGLQGVTATQSSGGPLSIDSPYNVSGNTVGTESTSFTPTFTTSNPVTSGTASLDILAKSANTDPASSDYTEVLTFLASASF